jgi:hypothetical protein
LAGKEQGLARVERSGLWELMSALLLSNIDAVHVETSLMAPLGVAPEAIRPGLKLVLDLHDIVWHLKAQALRQNRRVLSSTPYDVCST